MGTGSVSALLHNFPYNNNNRIVKFVALFFFLIDLGIFTFATTCTVWRYMRYPEVAERIICQSFVC